MTFSFDQKLTVTQDTLINVVEGESVLLNLKSENYFGLDPVGIVNVARFQEAEKIGLCGLDDILEPVIPISAVADKADGLDRRLLALGDFEHEVDAIVGKLDNLRHDAHVVTPVAAVLFDDALGVGLDDGP